jgi:hypothetical protein
LLVLLCEEHQKFRRLLFVLDEIQAARGYYSRQHNKSELEVVSHCGSKNFSCARAGKIGLHGRITNAAS